MKSDLKYKQKALFSSRKLLVNYICLTLNPTPPPHIKRLYLNNYKHFHHFKFKYENILLHSKFEKNNYKTKNTNDNVKTLIKRLKEKPAT